MVPHTSYLICTTNRSGSHLLCESLIGTGLAGKPSEFFWKDTEARLKEKWNLHSYRDYLQRVLVVGSSENGVFGSQIMMAQVTDFLRKLRGVEELDCGELSDPEVVAKAFPNLNYIWLTRRDKIRQAISFLKALQTGNWIYWLGGQDQKKPIPEREPEYSFAEIDFHLQGLTLYEAKWQDYFEAAGVTPHVVVYEDLCKDYEGTAIRILRDLKIPIPADLQFGPCRVARQADHLTEEWVRRFKSEKAEQMGGWTGDWPE